jgi:hypothetical protein
MSRVSAEPIHSPTVHPPHGIADATRHLAHPGHPRPATVDGLIAVVQREFPRAFIRITGRGRTVQRQAELMAQRRRNDRTQFLRTYRAARHITEMDNWVANHPRATEAETTAAFVEIINRARQHGALVSNHLSDHARDISIPHGTPHVRQQVRARLRELGGHVIDEHDAVTGPHWHVDY